MSSLHRISSQISDSDAETSHTFFEFRSAKLNPVVIRRISFCMMLFFYFCGSEMIIDCGSCGVRKQQSSIEWDNLGEAVC